MGRESALARAVADRDAARQHRAERPKQLYAFLDGFDRLDVPARRAELQRLVNTITVSPNGNVTIDYL